MTVKEAYIHLQQGLQNIAAFVYANVELPELDYFWNQGTDIFIQLAFPDKYAIVNPEKYQDVQASVDDLQVLEVLGYTNTIQSILLGKHNAKYITLPIDYRHLLNDVTLVKPVNCTTDETREVANRLTLSGDIKNLLDNSIFKTSINSPISRLSGNNLYVYTTYKGQEQFLVDGIQIDYLKKPDIVSYGIDGSTVIQFPDQVCFKIIKAVLIYMTIVAEQNTSKTQLLKQ